MLAGGNFGDGFMRWAIMQGFNHELHDLTMWDIPGMDQIGQEINATEKVFYEQWDKFNKLQMGLMLDAFGTFSSYEAVKWSATGAGIANTIYDHRGEGFSLKTKARSSTKTTSRTLPSCIF